MTAPGVRRPSRTDDPLSVYLRDHFAGSAAGIALVQRCRRANRDTGLDEVLADIETEIVEDRRALEAIMAQLGVMPSAFKAAVGRLGEVIGRAKSNGRVLRRSPSSTVVELEGLAAGIVTKRNLWSSLRAATLTHAELDVADLDRLVARATAQLERVEAEHDRAAEHAFGPIERTISAGG
jgi:hypothetical protein